MKTKLTLLIITSAFISLGSNALAGPDADTYALRGAIAKASHVSTPGCCSSCCAKTHYVLAHGKGNVVPKL